MDDKELEEHYTLNAIRVYGGSFMDALRRAYLMADADNRRKIRDTWAKEWEQYRQMGAKLRSDDQAISGPQAILE